MAIDSAPKRKSLVGVLGYFTGGPGVTPDATPGQEWRQQAGYGYYGILAGDEVIEDVLEQRQKGHILITTRKMARNVVEI